jgi:Domain of unknown function (DUF4173)
MGVSDNTAEPHSSLAGREEVPSSLREAVGDSGPDGAGSSPVPSLALAMVCVALTAAADLLFYDAQVGSTLGAFAALVLISSALLNPHLLASRWGKAAFALTLGLCAALIDYPSALAIFMTLAGLATFITSGFLALRGDALRWVHGLGVFSIQWLPRVIVDATRISGAVASSASRKSLLGAAVPWVLPLGLSALFLTLFYSANPIIASWIDALRWDVNTSDWFPAATRIAFWIFIAAAVWPFIRARIFLTSESKPSDASAEPPQSKRDWLWSNLLSQSSLANSLILFNAIFALQNGLDVEYLWAGAELPSGMTLAAYAHQSVYPLIATALLAAVFVLAAFPPGEQTKTPRLICALMVLWVAQNVFLVVSSMQRTMLYIDTYSLTHLRVTAMIWMALVAVGLVWIVLRIVRSRSAMWLINVNTVTLLCVLFVSCFIDFGAVIANYNVRHCREINGRSATLDLEHLGILGPSALPALRWFRSQSSQSDAYPFSWNGLKGHDSAIIERRFEEQLKHDLSDWRAWSYRWHRLAQAGE